MHLAVQDGAGHSAAREANVRQKVRESGEVFGESTGSLVSTDYADFTVSNG